jgi:hypothetical protein
VKGLVRPWLKVVPWTSVVAINSSLCQAACALHKPTSDGYERTKLFWEQNQLKELSLQELLQVCYKCHRLAPFCNYNGNTFVSVVRTLLMDTLKRMPPEKAHLLRSISGHIVAGTDTKEEMKALENILEELA